MNEKLVNYIETSFLDVIINLEGVTDISYNGSSFFYLHNVEGRKKSDLVVSKSVNEINDDLEIDENYDNLRLSADTE